MKKKQELNSHKQEIQTQQTASIPTRPQNNTTEPNTTKTNNTDNNTTNSNTTQENPSEENEKQQEDKTTIFNNYVTKINQKLPIKINQNLYFDKVAYDPNIDMFIEYNSFHDDNGAITSINHSYELENVLRKIETDEYCKNKDNMDYKIQQTNTSIEYYFIGKNQQNINFTITPKDCTQTKQQTSPDKSF